jgi:hypothetical protein
MTHSASAAVRSSLAIRQLDFFNMGKRTGSSRYLPSRYFLVLSEGKQQIERFRGLPGQSEQRLRPHHIR